MAARLTQSQPNFLREFLKGSEEPPSLLRYLLPVAIVGMAVVLFESRRLSIPQDTWPDAIRAASEFRAEATRTLTDLVNISSEATTALSQVHDVTTAETARQQLEAFNPLIEKARAIWPQVPEPFRQRFRASAAEGLEKLRLTVDLIVAKPEVSGILREPAEKLLDRLRPFT
jgi:hypothetical protein